MSYIFYFIDSSTSSIPPITTQITSTLLSTTFSSSTPIPIPTSTIVSDTTPILPVTTTPEGVSTTLLPTTTIVPFTTTMTTVGSTTTTVSFTTTVTETTTMTTFGPTTTIVPFTTPSTTFGPTTTTVPFTTTVTQTTTMTTIGPTTTTTLPTTTLIPASTTIPIETTTLIPTTTAPVTTTSTETTTSTLTPEPCFPYQSEPIYSSNLLLIKNISRRNYTNYGGFFVTPVGVTTALLLFEFKAQSIDTPWYFDDVSVKTSDGFGNELLRNSGFENGFSDLQWTYCYPSSPNTNAKINDKSPHSGKYCFQTSGELDQSEYLTQNFSIQGNTQYILDLYTFSLTPPNLFNVTIIFQ